MADHVQHRREQMARAAERRLGTTLPHSKAEPALHELTAEQEVACKKRSSNEVVDLLSSDDEDEDFVVVPRAARSPGAGSGIQQQQQILPPVDRISSSVGSGIQQHQGQYRHHPGRTVHNSGTTYGLAMSRSRCCSNSMYKRLKILRSPGKR